MSSKLAVKGPALGSVRDKVSQMYIWKRKLPSNLMIIGTSDARIALTNC